jgi:hypothetical protein
MGVRKKKLRARYQRLQGNLAKIQASWERENAELYHDVNKIGFHIGGKGTRRWKLICMGLAFYAASLPEADRMRAELRNEADQLEGDEVFMQTFAHLQEIRAKRQTAAPAAAVQPPANAVELDDADRQAVVLALAALSHRRPGWKQYLEQVAARFGPPATAWFRSFFDSTVEEMHLSMADVQRFLRKTPPVPGDAGGKQGQDFKIPVEESER